MFTLILVQHKYAWYATVYVQALSWIDLTAGDFWPWSEEEKVTAITNDRNDSFIL